MTHGSTTNTSKLNQNQFSIYITLCQIHSLYKCQIFQLYNFYVLYVLNTSHKLYIKLYMVSELSIFFLFLHPSTPPPWSLCGQYTSYWNAFLFSLIFPLTTPLPTPTLLSPGPPHFYALFGPNWSDVPITEIDHEVLSLTYPMVNSSSSPSWL